MKTILIPTDFSKPSLNAIEYGVDFARVTDAKVILFHVYHIPVITSDTPIIVPSVTEIEENCMEKLKKIANKMHRNRSEVKIEYKCASGFIVDEINRMAIDIRADLIIMGMQGTGLLTEKLIGSTTTSLMRKSPIPVLSIDAHSRFQSFKKITLACDYEDAKYSKVLNPLKEIATLFNSSISILNVKSKMDTEVTVTETVQSLKLEHSFEGFDHDFNYESNDNTVEGILNFIKKENSDLLVVIPRQHSFLHNIFNEPHTKQIAFRINIPLLTLNNNI